MSVFKVVARNPYTKRQEIKKVYETDEKFNKYGKETLKRYQGRHNVEVYQLIEDKYELLYELKMPQTKEEVYQYAKEMNHSDDWARYRLRDLENR